MRGAPETELQVRTSSRDTEAAVTKAAPEGAARDCSRPGRRPARGRQLQVSLARTAWLPDETVILNVVALTALLNDTATFAPVGVTVTPAGCGLIELV